MVSFTKFRPYERFTGRLEPRRVSKFVCKPHPNGSPLTPLIRTPSPLNTKSNFLSVALSQPYPFSRTGIMRGNASTDWLQGGVRYSSDCIDPALFARVQSVRISDPSPSASVSLTASKGQSITLPIQQPSRNGLWQAPRSNT